MNHPDSSYASNTIFNNKSYGLIINSGLMISNIRLMLPFLSVRVLWIIISVLFSLLIIAILVFVVFRKKTLANAILISDFIASLHDNNLPGSFKEKTADLFAPLVASINKMCSRFDEDYKTFESDVSSYHSEISKLQSEIKKRQREISRQDKELKSAYEMIKDGTDRYEKLIQHLEEEYIIYSQSLNGDILFVSPSVKKILGYDVTEFRDKYESLYTENPINNLAKERSANLRNGVAQPKYLKEIYNKTKVAKIFEVSEVPVFNEEGNLVAVEGLAHDITEKQKAEDLIKEQEEKYRMLFTHASDFIIMYELDQDAGKVGNIIEANNFTVEKLGYTINELRTKTPLDLVPADTVEPDDITAFEISNNEEIYERVWQAKEENLLNVEISSHAFHIKNKLFAIAVARDITERKKAEEEIRFINEELYNQKENLEALVDNLTQTQEQLVQSEKMAALGQLIAGIAHEINTPLGAIKASIGNMIDSLDLSLKELPDLFVKQSQKNLVLFNQLFELSRKKSVDLMSREKRQKRRDMAKKLEETGIEPSDVIADILTYLNIFDLTSTQIDLFKNPDALKVLRSVRNFISLLKNTYTINLAVEKATKVVFALKKYSHRDSVGEKVSTDIIDGIETVLTLYHNQLKQGIEVIKNYDKLPLVHCYQDEINQVWTNLIQNAIQAMKLEGTLIITTHSDGKNISVSFKDSGPGIEPDIIDEIFEPFFTTKKQGEGSGLGLDIVKRIIEKHKGNIEVDSKLGEGANFIVKIPIV